MHLCFKHHFTFKKEGNLWIVLTEIFTNGITVIVNFEAFLLRLKKERSMVGIKFSLQNSSEVSSRKPKRKRKRKKSKNENNIYIS